MTEGYIKFDCNWEQKEIWIQEEIYNQLEAARSSLFSLGLIGMYPDGIGFGNISARIGESCDFIITGSATGQFAKLNQSHYALVSAYNFVENSISCTGLTKASAESLTHAAIYEVAPEIGSVVHVHCLWLWEKLLKIYPTTSAEIEYGTPEMAWTVNQLASGMKMNTEKIIVMGGHREGILSFGRNVEDATSILINVYKRYEHD